MSILGWVLLGIIAGFIGSKIVDSEGQGFWLNVALGIIGKSFSAGFGVGWKIRLTHPNKLGQSSAK